MSTTIQRGVGKQDRALGHRCKCISPSGKSHPYMGQVSHCGLAVREAGHAVFPSPARVGELPPCPLATGRLNFHAGVQKPDPLGSSPSSATVAPPPPLGDSDFSSLCFSFIHNFSMVNRPSFLFFFFNNFSGTSLVIQWLRPCAPNAGGPGPILVRELDPTCHN